MAVDCRMRWYHYILLLLKIIFLVEFLLILYNKNLVSQKVYITTEILFKLLLSIYIQYIVFSVVFNNISTEDKIFISFASGLMMYDALFNDLPVLLELYGIYNTSVVR